MDRINFSGSRLRRQTNTMVRGPTLVTGIFLEAHRSGRAPIRLCLRYLLTVLVVFSAVNLPFLVWHPGAWWHGTLIPLTGGLVADGQGFVTLATHGLMGGVNLTMLSLAAALAMVGGIAAFVAWYPQLKRIWPLLLTVPFFFSPRSLSSYLVDLFPVALVAALSVDGVARRRPRTGPRTGLMMVRRGVTYVCARRCWWSPHRASASSSRRTWPSAGHLCSYRCAASARPTPERSSTR